MRVVSDYQYRVEVVREPGGQVLTQEPLDELTLLADEARYQTVSQGRLPDQPQHLNARLEPLDGAEEGPQLRGVRVRLGHLLLPAADFVVDFPSEIAAARGKELAALLAADGALQKGDRYRVRLTAVPAGAGGRSTFAGGQDPETEVAEHAFPVQRGSLADWGIPPDSVAAADPDRPVFVARAVIDQAVTDAVRHGNQETGKLLLGHLVEDGSRPAQRRRVCWSVVVSEQVDVPDAVATPTSVTFPPESLRRARQLADLRGRRELVIGSQHSHGWRCKECNLRCEIRNLFFSTDDVRMAALFPVYAVFLVVGGDPARDRDHPVANVYVRRQGTMRSVPFGVFP